MLNLQKHSKKKVLGSNIRMKFLSCRLKKNGKNTLDLLFKYEKLGFKTEKVFLILDFFL